MFAFMGPEPSPLGVSLLANRPNGRGDGLPRRDTLKKHRTMFPHSPVLDERV